MAHAVRDKILPLDDREWLYLVLNGVLRVRSNLGLPIEQGPLRRNLDIASSSSHSRNSNRLAVSESRNFSSSRPNIGGYFNNSVLSEKEKLLNQCATNFCSAVDKRRRTKLQEEVPRNTGGNT